MHLAKHWRQKPANYRLEGKRHRTTGEVRFPACPPTLNEQADEWEPYIFSGKGEIYSFSMIHAAASGYEDVTPYPVAMIKLEEGVMITAQLTDCTESEIEIGLPVEMVTRKLKDTGEDGLLVYGYKFRPRIEGKK